MSLPEMKGQLLFALMVLVAGPSFGGAQVNKDPKRRCLQSSNTIYNFNFQTLDGERTIKLSDFKGKMVIVANLATYCEFAPHYHGMNALKSKYGEELVILGFPCNQFGLQEPGKNHSEIMNGVKYIRPGNGFEPNFLILEKLDVNGDREHPFFTFLKKHCPSTRNEFSLKSYLFYQPFINWDIKWNWEKFLIDKTGKPYMRYDSTTEPLVGITPDIDALKKYGSKI